jgi:Zn-dependent protease with chaperone function/uncharacterized tellurite resistance protein B-like protein
MKIIKNDQLKTFAITFILAIAIPALGYLSAYGILSNVTGKFESALRQGTAEIPDDFSFEEMCRTETFSSGSTGKEVCDYLSRYIILEDISIYVGLLAIALITLVMIAGFLSNRSRTILVKLFKPGLKFTQLVTAMLVLGYGVILVATLYFLEAYWIKRVHYILIGGAALVTMFASIRVFGTLFSNFNSTETSVLGVSLKQEGYKKIWDMITDVARDAGTEPPDNLIVGMSPNFFVTEAKVQTLDGTFAGRTLYLSIPFCRTLTRTELKSIIAHELGHFVGKDTRFSKHFYPIYRGAHESINVIHEHTTGEGGLHTLALMPAMYMMSFFMKTFENIEKKIGRERELAADALAAKLYGNDSTTSALIKAHAYSNIWGYVEQKMLTALKEGKQIVNSSKFFEEIIIEIPKEYFSKNLGESKTEHPTDSHPPLESRIKALGKTLTDDTIEKSTQSPIDRASELIENVEEIEQALTEVEHRIIADRTGITLPKREEISIELTVLRSMISMILSDGTITEEELQTVKGTYNTLFEKTLSDEILSKEIENTKAWSEGLLDYMERAELRLTPSGKSIVVKALLITAYSDGVLHEKERELINQVARKLKISKEEFDLIVETLLK